MEPPVSLSTLIKTSAQNPVKTTKATTIKRKTPQEIQELYAKSKNTGPSYHTFTKHPHANQDTETEEEKGEPLKEFQFQSKPLQDLSAIDWNKITALSYSDSGTSGVYFAQLEDNIAFVMKGSPDTAVEYFSSLLLQKLNVEVPKIRVLTWSEPEFEDMIEILNKKTKSNYILNVKINNSFNRPHIMIMEYKPILCVGQLGAERAGIALDPTKPEGQERLMSLGMMLGVDAFLNNVDRIPFMPDWKNDGAIENIVIAVNSNEDKKAWERLDNLGIKYGGFVALDTRPFLINTSSAMGKKNAETYKSNYRLVLQSIFEQIAQVRDKEIDVKSLDCPRLAVASKISKFIQDYTLYDVQTEGEFQILKGMVRCFKQISSVESSDIQAIHEAVGKAPKGDWMNIWKENFESLNMEFLLELLEITKECCAKYKGVIEWVEMSGNEEHISESK